MRIIRLTQADTMPDAQVACLRDRYLYDHDYDRLITNAQGDVKVLKPDGSPLLVFRCQVLPAWPLDLAFPALLQAAIPTDNRGTAAGLLLPEELPAGAELVSPTRYVARKRDGTLSIRTRGKAVLSGTIGYMDADTQLPCRTTDFTRDKPKQWHTIQPLIGLVNGIFRDTLPDRYAAQLAAVQQAPAEFVIPGTAFSTGTANRNFQTAAHTDEGDLPEGFGVMSVIQAGEYSGGYLVFPKYRVAVDMRAGDVLLADVHEYHGNTPIIGKPRTFERISVVLYCRSGMRDCK